VITVKELIELLQKEDPERLVILSKDAEGNSYSPLTNFVQTAYVPETTWFGELDESGTNPEGQSCLVFYPTN